MPVADQKKSEIQHHAKRQKKTEGALSDAKELRSDHLETARKTFAELGTKAGLLVEANVCEPARCPRGQTGLSLDEQTHQVDLAAAHTSIERCRFAQQCCTQQYGRHHHDAGDDQQSCERCNIPASRHRTQ